MGFNQELKDFLGSAAAVQKMGSSIEDDKYKRVRRDYMSEQLKNLRDPVMQDLKKLQARANINRANAGANASNASADYHRARAKMPYGGVAGPGDATMPGDVGGYSDGAVSPSMGKRSALPMGDSYADAGADNSTSSFDDDEDDVSPPTEMASTGGAIGDVGDDDDGDDTPSTDNSDEASNDPTYDEYIEAANNQQPYSPPAYVPIAQKAVEAGLHRELEQHGLQDRAALPDTARTNAMRARLQGANAAAPSQMEAIRRLVDPKQQMSENERNMLSLGAVYDHYMKQNKPKEAQNAAASMLAYYRQVFNGYSAMAKVAASKGDVDGTVKAIAKAYANVPDGQEMKFTQDPKTGAISYSVRDAHTGKVVEQKVATPQDILGFAMKQPVNGDGFTDLIMRAEGTRGEAIAAKQRAINASPKAPKLRDLNDAETHITNIADQYPAIKTGDDKFDDSLNTARADIATHFRLGGTNGKEAMNRATQILDPTQKVEFKREDDGGASVELDDGRSLKLPRDQYLQAVAMRGKLAAMKSKKDADDKDKSDRVSSAKEQIGGALKNIRDRSFRGDDDSSTAHTREVATRRQFAVDPTGGDDDTPPPAPVRRAQAVPVSRPGDDIQE